MCGSFLRTQNVRKYFLTWYISDRSSESRSEMKGGVHGCSILQLVGASVPNMAMNLALSPGNISSSSFSVGDLGAVLCRKSLMDCRSLVRNMTLVFLRVSNTVLLKMRTPSLMVDSFKMASAFGSLVALAW